MATTLIYDISFNKTQTFARYEEALIKKILGEVVAMNGDFTTLLETEYNQIQVIQGFHTSRGEDYEHITVRLFNNFGFAEKNGARRTGRGDSGLYHLNLNSDYEVTSITQVTTLRLRR